MQCAEALEQPRPEAPNKKIVLVAAVALVDPDNRVLIAQRPEGKSMAGLWEFPGGKVGEGETPEYALMRELEEELGIETRPTCYLPIGFASHSYDDFHLLMPLFICRYWKNVPRAKEHKALKWVKVNDLGQYEMPAADLPLIESLRLVT
jgi:8-oxo-dGTP diphosphatase